MLSLQLCSRPLMSSGPFASTAASTSRDAFVSCMISSKRERSNDASSHHPKGSVRLAQKACQLKLLQQTAYQRFQGFTCMLKVTTSMTKVMRQSAKLTASLSSGSGSSSVVSTQSSMTSKLLRVVRHNVCSTLCRPAGSRPLQKNSQQSWLNILEDRHYTYQGTFSGSLPIN